MREKIDIVHIMFPSWSCYIARKVAQRLRIPVVGHFHTQPENITIFMPKFMRNPFVEKLVAKYLIWFIRPAVVTLSPSQLGKDIIHECDPSIPVTILSNGINLAKFYEAPIDSFMRKFKREKEHKHILCIARLTKEKDPETLVRAMKYILEKEPHAYLDLVGVGPLSPALEKICEEDGTTDHVSFLGKISEDDLLAALNACDLFVLPSYVELEGMVVLEAMACRKPILIADAKTSASRFFVKDNGLLFKAGDARDLADKALSILTDENLKLKMGAESYKDAQEYDINKSVEKLEGVYRSALNTPSSSK